MLTGAEAERLGMVIMAVPNCEVLDWVPAVAETFDIGSQTAIRWRSGPWPTG
jgi:enoyl-CoA hydratase/carnithine racemase